MSELRKIDGTPSYKKLLEMIMAERAKQRSDLENVLANVVNLINDFDATNTAIDDYTEELKEKRG